MGMTVIGLSMFGSFGLCFYFGFFYTDMTPIVPFLLLGLGVDNMFVMVQVNSTPQQEEQLSNGTSTLCSPSRTSPSLKSGSR